MIYLFKMVGFRVRYVSLPEGNPIRRSFFQQLHGEWSKLCGFIPYIHLFYMNGGWDYMWIQARGHFQMGTMGISPP